MSESLARKIQPFTIGTRLSAPAVPKCQEFGQSYLQSQNLDNCALQRNLNSLYLGHSQVRAHGPRLVSSITRQVDQPAENRREDAEAQLDQLNQNLVPTSAVSRSIKKITISGSKNRSEGKVTVAAQQLLTTRPKCENNNNNNNVNGTSDSHLPRIVGVSCENKPSSQFKVLLRKDSCDKFQPSGQSSVTLNEERSNQKISAPQSKESRPRTPTQEPPAAAASPSDSFTQRNSLFSKEALQAEAWIKGKLQDLKDGCNIQRCPLQDLDEASQTLQRDLKDFENTLIQLNQMGEQLICKTNPTSDLVRKQLSHLKDQWQTLKQTAANQKRALGGAKSLQEFNKKVDKLEAWIKEKEEEPHLVNVLDGNVDKVQLTRKILDLKQDEQLYRNLHEEINHLALKLEKQEKTDGKNISSRRKHINKMWLKAQAHLKNYHENLQLALEVSSFYQQADNTMFAIDNMRENISASKVMEGLGEREIRDIASQIMMLDVSMSQLSNLHPRLAAGITQKQSEVKDCWLLLQKLFRSDRTTHAPNGSTFARETADPLTPGREPQCIVGTDAQRIMGKEVKEEQNRLKGCASAPECGFGTKSPGSQSQQQQQSVSHAPSPMGSSACTDDVIVRHLQKGERKPRAEPKLHVQLQKFPVSVDKTLSWLKDNVSMATQVCSVASFEGLEAARRCQQALEQEILTNRARIEVVKREGRGLVRARHPGSAKIEEFLGQLEALWEELQRRHQRNAIFLQTSGELGFRVVKLLQALGSLEAWLESVELSMKESALAGDPETMSTAERQSCLLEKEVAARRTELGALKQEVDCLQGHSHPLTQGLYTRMEKVEQKYHRVHSALTQQNSELRDTRMLTEFLERVELEESQELDGSHYSLGQPLHSEISAAPTLLGLQSSGSGEPLMEGMGDPVEELREAVEMLNDTVRERGRAQSHDHAVQELLKRHAGLLVRVEECVCRCNELSLDILERETDMAVQCEPDRCGLRALEEKRDHLEVDFDAIGEKVEELERRAAQLQELCPDRMHLAGAKIQALLQGWTELERSVAENKFRLEEFVRLQDFFRSYLAMISWTEDTRSRIFSDAALQLGTDGRRPVAAELDTQIEQKFEEFDELVATGQNILGKEHHLTQMVMERMEELRSMLGWILVHWRAQKQQWLHRNNRREPVQDNIYTEAAMCSPLSENSVSELEFPTPHQPHQPHQSPAVTPDEDKLKAACDKQPLFLSFIHAEQDAAQLEDGYEVMKSVAPPPGSPKPSIVLPGGPSAGGTVNLILSLGNTVDGQVQVLDPPAAADEVTSETSEPLHRVSTYLHVKDNCVAAAPVYESITLPRQKCCPSASPAFSTLSSSTSSSSSSSSSSASSSPSSAATTQPQAANVTFHQPQVSGNSLFSSLKRMGKKRKRKRDARRHTIQKIMGVEEQREVLYDTHTWPLKEGRRKKSSGGAPTAAYVKNPLQGDIETECCGEYSITPYAVSEGQPAVAAPPATHARGHCRFLSLGSVLSFDLPKDMTLIPPSIQDIITIAPPESKTLSDPDPLSQRHTALSSFRQTRANPTIGATTAPASKDQTFLCDELHENQLSAHEEAEQEWEKISSGLKISAAERERDESSPTPQPPIYVNQVQNAAQHKHHKCLSVHTRIQDLNGHLYHKCIPGVQGAHGENAAPRCHGGHASSSHMVVSLKSMVNVSVRQDSVDSGISTASSARLGADATAAAALCPDSTQAKGVVGRLVSLQVGGLDCGKSRDATTCSPQSESIHPDHQQFEEEEEELQDIWNRTASHRQSVCSDIMYQPGNEQLPPSGLPVSEVPSPKSPAVLYRNLATASAPNLLVAEFKLPPSVQSWLGYNKDQGARGQLPPLATGDRRSWAAFPNREPTKKASVAVNETAAEAVRLPDVCDNQKYVYQYREDEEEEAENEEEEEQEEEEAERAKVGEEGDEHGSFSKDESMSLLSVHMGLENLCQQRIPSLNLDNIDKQEGLVATGGRCLALSGKAELQAMEGTLERKQKLQLGGKKAASRGWSSYHTVLHRHTLCFYQDRKDTLRSSACGLPLNLTGAQCSPVPEYTKKPNCFQLRLRDGSEYLLSTPSRFMMKKWMMKIQANMGQDESFLSSVDPALPTSIKPSFCSSCGGLAQCCCPSQHDVTSTFPRRKRPGAAQPKEIVVLTREFTNLPHGHLRSVEERPTVVPTDQGCGGDDEERWKQTMTHRMSNASVTSPASGGHDWLGNKHRSHSFTSATYQKIKPVTSHTPALTSLEKGSNYCVTLVVGDKSSDSQAPSRSSDPPLLTLAGWQQVANGDSASRSYASLPRPCNKSVFKRFFGKRDL